MNRQKPSFGDLSKGYVVGVSSYDCSKNDTPVSRNSPRKVNPVQIPFENTKYECSPSRFSQQHHDRMHYQQYQPDQNIQYQPDQNIQYQPDQNIQYQPDQNTQYQPDQNIQYQPDQNIQYQPDQNIQYQPDQNIQYGAEYAYAMDPYQGSYYEPIVSDPRSQHPSILDSRNQHAQMHGVPYLSSYELQQNFAHGDPYQNAHPAPVYASQQYPGMNYQQPGETDIYWHDKNRQQTPRHRPETLPHLGDSTEGVRDPYLTGDLASTEWSASGNSITHQLPEPAKIPTFSKPRVKQTYSDRSVKTHKVVPDPKLSSFSEIPEAFNFNNEDEWEPTEQQFYRINSYGGKG